MKSHIKSALFLFLISAGSPRSFIVWAGELYVVGFTSNNVIQFDLESKQSRVYDLKQGDNPRGVAVGSDGTLYVSLRSGNRNIVKYAPGIGFQDLTETIPQFGCGNIEIDEDDNILLAANIGTDSHLFKYDRNGNLLSQESFPNGGNLLGLTYSESLNTAFATAFSNGNLISYDFSFSETLVEVIPQGADQLASPHGITIGHDNNLYVADFDTNTVQRIDKYTGDRLGEFIDLSPLSVEGLRDVEFNYATNSYYVAAGKTVYQFDTEGLLQDLFTHPSLSLAHAIEIVDEPFSGGTLVDYLYVAGFSSDNVYRFNIESGDGKEIIKFEEGSRPRGLAFDNDQNLYIGLRGGTQNVKRYSREGMISDLSQSIAGNGHGHLEFNTNYGILAAGDISDSSSVYQIDQVSGSLLRSFNFQDVENVIAVTSTGDSLFFGDYFDGTLVTFDLSVPSPTGSVLISELSSLQSMTIGHNQNLFITENDNKKVLEYDAETGEFIGEFADFKILPGEQIRDIEWNSRVGSYFITIEDRAYRITQNGIIIQFYSSPQLSLTYGLESSRELLRQTSWIME